MNVQLVLYLLRVRLQSAFLVHPMYNKPHHCIQRGRVIKPNGIQKASISVGLECEEKESRAETGGMKWEQQRNQ